MVSLGYLPLALRLSHVIALVCLLYQAPIELTFENFLQARRGALWAQEHVPFLRRQVPTVALLSAEF